MLTFIYRIILSKKRMTFRQCLPAKARNFKKPAGIHLTLGGLTFLPTLFFY